MIVSLSRARINLEVNLASKLQRELRARREERPRRLCYASPPSCSVFRDPVTSPPALNAFS